jgi:ABC-type spermidine/putrescine transport system permease subunit II
VPARLDASQPAAEMESGTPAVKTRALSPGAWPRRIFERFRGRREYGLDHPLLSTPAVLFVVVGFVLPMLVIVLYSFWPTTDSGQIVHHFSLTNYDRFFSSSLYAKSLLKTFWVVGLSAGLTVALTFPFAYFVAMKVPPSRRIAWILLAIMPFWTSYLIRVFSWLNIFGDSGAANTAVKSIGLSNQPLGIFEPGTSAIIITFVYLLFPLAFLTSYVTLERADPSLRHAASDLGARPWQVLGRVTLPLAATGLLAGFAFAFISMMGDYVTPKLIGGTSGTLFANLVVNQFGVSSQWGYGAVLALVMLISVFCFLLVMRRVVGARQVGEFTRRFEPEPAPFLRLYSLLFLLFLYLPVALVILFAFNGANYVGFPIQGLTTHWFSDVFNNIAVRDAFSTSLQVAGWAVGFSLLIGIPAAVQLSRTHGFGRNLRLAVLALPLLVPPVVIGLGIIIGLNALGIQRNFWFVVAGHTLLILPIVVLIVMARLEGMDRNQELAAMDLGAPPWRALVSVTVPQALPAIIAAAMLGFAISLDEFIMTFLVTSTTTTLPLYIYGSLRFSIDPSLDAIAALVLFASLVLALLAALVAGGFRGVRRRRGEREQERPEAVTQLLPT